MDERLPPRGPARNPDALASVAAEWLTTREVSLLTGIAEQTLAIWRHNGTKGPKFSRPLPRVVRYRRSDVEQWLADAAVRSTAEADARDRSIA